MKAEILKKMHDQEHRDSMWYGGTVAMLEVGPYKFELVANGDVEAELWKDDETFLAEVKDTENLGPFMELCAAIFNLTRSFKACSTE